MAPNSSRRPRRLSTCRKSTNRSLARLRNIRSIEPRRSAASTSGETVFLARERHLQALARAQEHLAAAAACADAEHGYGNAQLELFAEELRLAGSRLSEITGEVTADDLLGRIFSRFCIGK